MGVILQVALPSRVLAAARLQCGAAGAGASRGLGVCAEHARLAARGESPRDMEIDDFLVGLGPGRNSQCAHGTTATRVPDVGCRRSARSLRTRLNCCLSLRERSNYNRSPCSVYWAIGPMKTETCPNPGASRFTALSCTHWLPRSPAALSVLADLASEVSSSKKRLGKVNTSTVDGFWRPDFAGAPHGEQCHC